MSTPAGLGATTAQAADFFLLTASLPAPTNVPKDQIWSPPPADEVARLSIQATQGATEGDRAEAVSKLTESIFHLSSALSQSQKAQRLAEAKLNEALLKQFLSPILTAATKEKDAPPATEGPESESWAPFVAWELKHTLPTPQFSVYQLLLARRDNFRTAALATAPLSQLDSELSQLRNSWQSDQGMLAIEREALPRVSAHAQKMNQDAIHLHHHRDAAMSEIQSVRERAIVDITSLFIPFAELVTQCAEAERFASALNLSSIQTIDQLSHKEYQGLQNRCKAFIEGHPDLFSEGKEEMWKEIKEKARLLRGSLSATLNRVLCNLIRKKVELELFGFVIPLQCTLLNEVLRDYFLMLEEFKHWKERHRLLPLDPRDEPDSTDLLKRAKKVLNKWEGLEAGQAKEVMNRLTKVMPEDPKLKYKEVLNAPLLYFSPEEQRHAVKQLQELHEEIIFRCKCVKWFKEHFKLDDDLHMLDLLKGSSNMPFAELVIKMIFLQKDMERCKEEYKSDKVQLNLRFSHFTVRFRQLEERMHEISEENFKKWQMEIQKAVNAQKVHWELRDIHKIGSDLSFEMRHFQQAVEEGKFPFVTVQATKEFFSKITQFSWRGPVTQPVSGSQKDRPQ
ncbi:MAG: hypothetical protein LLG04_14830 [Parachlamydia sp.]|nr:hypothetical protein [Parachlamydia sp.]